MTAEPEPGPKKRTKYILGVEIADGFVSAGLVLKTGETVKAVNRKLTSGKSAAALTQILRAAGSLRSFGGEIKTVGISAQGKVTAKKGEATNLLNRPDWGPVDLAGVFSEAFEAPAYVESSGNAAAIGEFLFGAGKNLRSFLNVTLGAELTGGLILKEKVYRGETGLAGAVGHLLVDVNGPRCSCGASGCLNAYLSTARFIGGAAAQLGKHSSSKLFGLMKYDMAKLSPALLAKAAARSDDFARQVITGAGVTLGRALASAAAVLDIGTAVVGGYAAGLGPAFLAAAENAAKERLGGRGFTVLPASVPLTAGPARGAAVAAYRR